MKPMVSSPERAAPAPRNRRVWLFAGISVLLGIAAAVLSNQYLRQRLAQGTQDTTATKTSQILVASKALPKGTALSTDNVSVRTIPVASRHSQALDPALFDKIDGRKLAYSLQAGEAVFLGLVQRPLPEAFSAQVEPGRRAVTIQVDEISSISGLLEPGDRIDVVASQPAVTPSDRREVYLLVQNSKVMATGQRSVDDQKSGETKRFSTVTLDLSVEDASRLIKARDGGRLTAMLRNRNDNELVTTLAPESRRAEAPAPRVARAAAPAALRSQAGIPVLYGGNGTAAAKPGPSTEFWMDPRAARDDSAAPASINPAAAPGKPPRQGSGDAQ